MIYKRNHPPNNKPNPRFANSRVLDDIAAPVETATLLVALAGLEVADPEPELREAVPEAAEAEEAVENRQYISRKNRNWVAGILYLSWSDWKSHQQRRQRKSCWKKLWTTIPSWKMLETKQTTSRMHGRRMPWMLRKKSRQPQHPLMCHWQTGCHHRLDRVLCLCQQSTQR